MNTIDIILTIAVIALFVMLIIFRRESNFRIKRLLEIMKKYRELADEIMKQLEAVQGDCRMAKDWYKELFEYAKELDKDCSDINNHIIKLYRRDVMLADTLLGCISDNDVRSTLTDAFSYDESDDVNLEELAEEVKRANGC